MNGNIVLMYRGFEHPPKNGGWSDEGILWLSEDVEYAMEYGDFVVEYALNEDAVRSPTMEELEETLGRNVVDELIDGLSFEDRAMLRSRGYNSVFFSTDSADILMLFDSVPVVSSRLLSEDEMSELVDF